jgi:molecular chaperone DnaK (HSP70)
MTHRFSLGIDLGTSNSAVAVTDLESDETEVVEITQILAPNRVGEQATLPSALYIPNAAEFPDDALAVPWSDGGGDGVVVGQFARDHGALVPDRLIASAKSWLSNPHIDPRQRVLPWKSTIEEAKWSAVQCSGRYLEHLRDGFSHAQRLRGRDWDLADGDVVVTVPASFDEVARNLTAEAAEAAGLGKVTLLEEPQAAFYAWVAEAGRDWRARVNPGDIVLVCDVGGGTADFSLIAVNESQGELALERISVGEHILLGGDNMDLALAYTVKAELDAAGTAIDEWQLLALVHAVAKAKVALFDDASLTEVPIAIPSRGSSLFAGSVATRLTRAVLEQVVVEGFFPLTPVTELPREGRRTGLQEFGLPYAADPVISKHLARFLTRSRTNVKASEALSALVGADAMAGGFLAPSAVLFNGGVFKAAAIRERVLDLLTGWNGGLGVRALEGIQPDLAVARGAALYGRNRATGKGIRIKAGAARSYYVGLDSSMPAIPGFRPPVKALCVVPQGMEEGSSLLIDGQTFGLVTGEPADFRFFSSEVRSGDAPGALLADAERDLDETSQLEVTLPALDDVPAGQAVPVQIESQITELGTLELWMKHVNSDRRWKVEFTVRTE